MMTGLAIAAALALAKDQLVDKPKEQRMRTLSAAKERNSPWTGVHGADVDESNTLGTVMQGAAVGAQMGQGYENAQSANRFRDAQSARLNTGGNLYGGWGGGGGKDFTANSLGGEDYAKALGSQSKTMSASMSPYSKTGSGYEDLEASGLSPDANYFKGTPWYTR